MNQASAVRWNVVWQIKSKVRQVLPSGTTLFFALLVAILLWLILVPLGQMILSSFQSGDPLAPVGFTLNNYLVAYTNALTYRMILNTLLFATGGTVISVLIAVLFAWLIERTDMPLRNLCWSLILVPLAMPGLLFSMAYILLFIPRTGVMNIFLRNLLSQFGIEISNGPINIYSLGGMIFLDGIKGVTSIFLLIVGAFRMMDPALEEASWSAGASNRQTLIKVTIPVLSPAILAGVLYSFTSSMESMETPLLVGVPARIFVYSTLIYYSARGPIDDYGMAATFAVSYFLIALLLAYFYQRAVVIQSWRFSTVTGKGYRPRIIPLGKWGYFALGLFALYFILTVLLPLAMLVWASLLPSYRVPSWDLLSQLTFRNYRLVFTEERNTVTALWNTLAIGASTATATSLIAFAVSWLVIRTKIRARLVLDGIAFASHAIPGIVIALAFLLLYLQPPFRELGLYGTKSIICLALISQYIAFATRATNPAITQIHSELEDAAEVSGASRLRVVFGIILPLIRPAFIATWVWVAAHAVKSFSIPLMLASRSNQPLSILLWEYWDLDQNFSQAAALGVLFLSGLTLMTICARGLIVRSFKQG
jgi:iron(III) transport system permease protein